MPMMLQARMTFALLSREGSLADNFFACRRQPILSDSRYAYGRTTQIAYFRPLSWIFLIWDRDGSFAHVFGVHAREKGGASPVTFKRGAMLMMIGRSSLIGLLTTMMSFSRTTAALFTIRRRHHSSSTFRTITRLLETRLNNMSSPENPRIIALFDVDGTLTIPRGEVTPDMMEFMLALSKKITVGIVGGSDLPKQEEQLGEGIAKVFPYNFSQNGLVAYKNGELLESQTIAKFLGEDNIKRVVNWVLKYLSELDLPVKRGTFIEFRSGMLNISPIGRDCSRPERNDYEKFDLEHNIRKTMVEAMRKEFVDLNLTYSIGGQISFDCFPTGWDKTYCLKYVNPEDFDEVHFFGDKTFEGGNDFEIFSHERTIGHTVTSPEDTKEQCTKLFMS